MMGISKHYALQVYRGIEKIYIMTFKSKSSFISDYLVAGDFCAGIYAYGQLIKAETVSFCSNAPAGPIY